MPSFQYTKRQSEYLAFISQYENLMEMSPSEGDIAAFFDVAGASAHQMVVALERKGALRRVGGVARSIQLLVDSAELPVLGWTKSTFRAKQENLPPSSIVAVLEFSDFLAHRICGKHTMTLPKVGAVNCLADRISSELRNLGAPEELTDLIIEYLTAMPWESKKGSAGLTQWKKRLEGEAPKSRQRRSAQENPKQGTLFDDF